MKNIYIALFVMATAPQSWGQLPFEKIYTGLFLNNIIINADKELLSVAENENSPVVTVVKLDSTGGQIWQKDYFVPSNGFNNQNISFPSKIINTSTNLNPSYVISGRTWGYDSIGIFPSQGGLDRGFILKIEGNGDTLYSKLIGLKVLGYDGIVNSGVFLQDSSIVVIIKSYNGSTTIARLNQITGDTIWASIYIPSTSNVLVATEILSTNDSNIVIAGRANLASPDYFLMKLDINNNVLWSRNIGDAAINFAQSVAQTNDGGYIIAGTTSINGNYPEDPVGANSSIQVVRTDNNGDTIWAKSYSETGYGCQGDKIIATSDGGFVIKAATYDYNINPNSPKRNSLLMKINSAGAVEWAKKYGDSTRNVNIQDFVQAQDKGFYLCGNIADSSGFYSYGGYIVKTDSLGNSCSARNVNITVQPWTVFDSTFTTTKITNSTAIFTAHFADSAGTSVVSNYCSILASTKNNSQLNETAVYPNPANEYITFSISENPASQNLYLYNIFGQLVYHSVLQKNTAENIINISALQNGMYIYKITDGVKVTNGKFVVDR